MVEAISAILVLAFFAALVGLIVGVVYAVTRKQWKFAIIGGAITVGLLVILIIFMGATGQLDDTETETTQVVETPRTTDGQVAISPAPTSTPEPTPIPEPTATPESKFNCRDLELEYLNMSSLGYEAALMHVSNVMSLKDDNPFAYYTSGDAERELQKCGVIPR